MLGRRLGLILAAYAAATLAASLFLNLALPVATAWPGPVPRLDLGELAKGVLLGWGLVAGFGFLPALVFVAWAEWRGQRRLFFFLASGAAGALLALTTLGRLLGPAASNLDEVTTIVVAATGALAGLVYWAITGRFAGGRPPDGHDPSASASRSRRNARSSFAGDEG